MRFAEIVRSSTAVRQAFVDCPAVNAWWNVILRFHGKPMGHVHRDDRQFVLANGFRFYGQLYCCLAGVFLVASAFTSVVASSISPAHTVALFVAGGYLGVTSQVALVAARRYQIDPVGASALLVAFFVAIMVFAACFVGGAAVYAFSAFPEQWFLIISIAGAFVLLGIGSYLIEILFLFFDSANSNSDAPFP